MRKSLLTLILALLSSMATMADYYLKFCGFYDSAMGQALDENQKLRVSISIPADMATQLAGNTITEIHYAMNYSLHSSTYNPVPVTVFVMENGEYVCTGYNADALNHGCDDVLTYGTLDNPYIIKKDTSFTFGFILEKPIEGLYPIGISYSGVKTFSGKVQTLQDGYVVSEIPNLGDISKGIAAYLYAPTYGPIDALLNYVVLEPYGNSLPTVEEGSEVSLSFRVCNISSIPIPSMKLDIEVAGNTTQFDYRQRLNSGASKIVEVTTPPIPQGRNQVSIKVVQTGAMTPASEATYTASVIGLAPDQGYPQKVVVEENTGTWCGWCPRGIVSMQYMSQNHPDNFIGICVHGGGQDPLVTASYNDLSKFTTNYPGSVTNRQSAYIMDPKLDNLEKTYNQITNNRSIGQIGLEVVSGENELYAVSTTDFAFDHFCRQGYKVAFVIIENGLICAQTNYYSGQAGSLEWWDTQGSNVVWTFSDTARDIFDFYGLEESLIKGQISSTPYRFQTTLPLTNVKDM